MRNLIFVILFLLFPFPVFGQSTEITFILGWSHISGTNWTTLPTDLSVVGHDNFFPTNSISPGFYGIVLENSQVCREYVQFQVLQTSGRQSSAEFNRPPINVLYVFEYENSLDNTVRVTKDVTVSSGTFLSTTIYGSNVLRGSRFTFSFERFTGDTNGSGDDNPGGNDPGDGGDSSTDLPGTDFDPSEIISYLKYFIEVFRDHAEFQAGFQVHLLKLVQEDSDRQNALVQYQIGLLSFIGGIALAFVFIFGLHLR